MGYLKEKMSRSVLPVFHALILSMTYAKENGYKHVKAIGNCVDLNNMVLLLLLLKLKIVLLFILFFLTVWQTVEVTEF